MRWMLMKPQLHEVWPPHSWALKPVKTSSSVWRNTLSCFWIYFQFVLRGDGDIWCWQWLSVDGRLSCGCIQAEEVPGPPWPRRRCRTGWWYPLAPCGDPRRTPGQCRRRRACPPLRGGLDAAPRSRNTAERWWKHLTWRRWVKRRQTCPSGSTWILLKYCPASNGTTL